MGSHKKRAVWSTVAQQCRSEVLFLPGHHAFVFSLSISKTSSPLSRCFEGQVPQILIAPTTDRFLLKFSQQLLFPQNFNANFSCPQPFISPTAGLDVVDIVPRRFELGCNPSQLLLPFLFCFHLTEFERFRPKSNFSTDHGGLAIPFPSTLLPHFSPVRFDRPSSLPTPTLKNNNHPSHHLTTHLAIGSALLTGFSAFITL